MMQLKDLCLMLVRCESENEVIDILTKEKYWDNEEDWQYYGNDESNFSIIGNQQSKPEAAIVEKIINSVDAMLLGECLKHGINPEGPDAPSNVTEALVRYFNIYEGKLTNLPVKERSRLAENIMFIATGEKKTPNYTIADLGEGQSPKRLQDTILSLRKSNKLRIPFVQGKFNMGGTGVFRFCGERNIQLVLSKRHPEVAKHEEDPTKDLWGFTIIRREDPVHGARSSNYKFLAPRKEILSFPALELEILPKEYPNAFGSSMKSGTFIKFFEYKIGPGLKTNILFDLYNKLSILMPHIALPVKLYERRRGYSGKSFETVLSGLSVRVEEDRSDNIEENFPTSGTMTVNGQKMKYSIYVFKKGKHEKFTKDEGIVFTINGQTHGYLPKSFFYRKGVGLSYLAESTLVILDCSEIDGRAREDLFMNSRDRISNCPLKYEIENELERVLKNHPGLRLLKDKRRKEEIEDRLNDQKPLAEILQNILKKSPTLSRLFVQGLKLQNPFNVKASASEVEYDGKEFPTFFTLTKKFPYNKPKLAHQNNRFRLEFKTDAANDYFDRSKDPGSFRLFVNGNESENADINLWNGFAQLNVKIEEANIGDLVLLRSEVTDLTRANSFVEEFYAKIIEPLPPVPGGGGERKPPASNKGGLESKQPEGLEMPKITEVTKDGRSGHSWDEQGFDEYSALLVKGNSEDGYDFFINLDNIHLLSEQKPAKSSELIKLQAQYKFGLVLIGLAILNDTSKSKNSSAKVEEDGENIFETISKITRTLSPIIIPMIDSLGNLDLPDSAPPMDANEG